MVYAVTHHGRSTTSSASGTTTWASRPGTTHEGYMRAQCCAFAVCLSSSGLLPRGVEDGLPERRRARGETPESSGDVIGPYKVESYPVRVEWRLSYRRTVVRPPMLRRLLSIRLVPARWISGFVHSQSGCLACPLARCLVLGHVEHAQTSLYRLQMWYPRARAARWRD